MKIFISIPLTLCTLLFINFGSFVNATRRPWTTAENRCSITSDRLTFRWYHQGSRDLIYSIRHDYYETNWDDTGCFWGASGNVTRRARAVNKPTPVDCVMGRWSSWTPCDSCTDKKVVFFSVNLSKVFFFNQINVYSSLQKHLSWKWAVFFVWISDQFKRSLGPKGGLIILN